MDAAIVSYVLENGPVTAIAGGLFWLWRKEIDARRAAEQALTDELRGQIALWKDIKEASNGAA